MPPLLSLGVFGAEMDGAWLLLDVDADRYRLGLSPEARARSYPRLGQAAIDPRPATAIWPTGVLRVSAAWLALAHLGRINRALKHGGLTRLLLALLAHQPRGRRPRLPAEDLVTSFGAVRPYFPASRICRLDGPALLLLLWSYGHPATLQFGARLEPFSGHCWVELGGRAVNEDPLDLGQYTPLLCVRP